MQPLPVVVALSAETFSSAGTGGGSAGGNAVFGLPAAAIAAATRRRNTGT
jgi:MYXO-CTERM domain-containing protein